ncbi:MAG: hypothetical protein V9E90_02215 [Saprospiraceae bacterium]
MAAINLFISKAVCCKSILGFKTTTTLVYIPQNLEIRGLIRQSPIPVKLCKKNIHQQADKVAILLYQIVNIQALKKSMNVALEEGFVRLNSTILQSIVKDYKIYLQWMEAVGILECDPWYSKGSYSKAYRLGLAYRGRRIKNYVISDNVLVKKLQAGDIDLSSKAKYPKLYDDLMDLEFEDFHAAINDVTSKTMRIIAQKAVSEDIKVEIRKKGKNSKYKNLNPKLLKIAKRRLCQEKINSWQNSLAKINVKQFYFKQDHTSFRLHTSAVSVKKELRKHLRINGQRLVACDIKNSQPYFSIGFFLNPGKFKETIEHYIKYYQGTKLDWAYHAAHHMLGKFESNYLSDSTRKYIELVSSGQFYEFIARELQKLNGKTWSREEAKKAVFDVLFCPPRFKKLPGRKVMNKYFPEVLRFFTLINYGYTKTKSQSNGKIHQGNFLARVLQKMESQVVLDIICKQIKSKLPEIPLITLHDGITTTIGNQYQVQQIMSVELEKFVGKPPIIEIEWEKWGIGRYP